MRNIERAKEKKAIIRIQQKIRGELTRRIYEQKQLYVNLLSNQDKYNYLEVNKRLLAYKNIINLLEASREEVCNDIKISMATDVVDSTIVEKYSGKSTKLKEIRDKNIDLEAKKKEDADFAIKISNEIKKELDDNIQEVEEYKALADEVIVKGCVLERMLGIGRSNDLQGIDEKKYARYNWIEATNLLDYLYSCINNSMDSIDYDELKEKYSIIENLSKDKYFLRLDCVKLRENIIGSIIDNILLNKKDVLEARGKLVAALNTDYKEEAEFIISKLDIALKILDNIKENVYKKYKVITRDNYMEELIKPFNCMMRDDIGPTIDYYLAEAEKIISLAPNNNDQNIKKLIEQNIKNNINTTYINRESFRTDDTTVSIVSMRNSVSESNGVPSRNQNKL